MSKLYEIQEFLGEFKDAKILTNGGTYHKVIVDDVWDGSRTAHKFYSRKKAFDFAIAQTQPETKS